jgi:CheY-like chemotaxis protein
MMGGTIDYASRARGGTRFWLDLPLQEHVGAVPFERPSLEASDWTFAHSGSVDRAANSDTPARDRSARGHILVVEDNAINAMVVEAQLGRLGCTCRVAADGEEALQRLASNETFHLVLMDCMLPGITGMEVAKRWREIEAAKGLPHLPIVALTANALATNVQETKEAGMDDFLTKPCTLDKLEVAVGRWIGAPSAGQSHE